MLIRKAFKYRLKPRKEAVNKFVRFAGTNRFLWNKTLALQKSRLDQQLGIMKYNDVNQELQKWKQEDDTKWLQESHSQVLQQVLKNLDTAIWNAFNKTHPAKFPIFKKKGVAKDSFRYPQGFQIEQHNNRIKLPKVGWVRYINSRSIEGTPKNVTVSRDGAHWYISIQVEMEIGTPIHSSNTEVGLDLGVVNFATLSDGEVFDSINAYRTHERKLKKAHRNVSRKVKGSNNNRKAITKLSNTYRKVRNIRKDFQHKTSTEISKNHAMIFVENLKIKLMSKSASGTKENPGTNIKQKSGLNKSILDQGWSEFLRQLEYKQLWSGGHIMSVDPKNTSRKCNECGFVSKENRKTQATFICISCGHHDNADVNAAKNILEAGHALLAYGVELHLDPLRSRNLLVASATGIPFL
jgi:putative transposase